MQSQQQQFDFNANSLNNWRNIIHPELGERQNECLNVIRYLGRATNAQVAAFLNVFPNVTSGRIGELERKKLIRQVGTIKIGRSTHAIMEVA